MKTKSEKSASFRNNFSFYHGRSCLGNPHARHACDWWTLIPLSKLGTSVTTVLRVTFEPLLCAIIVACKYASSQD